MNNIRSITFILILCFFSSLVSYSQTTPRFRITKIYNSSRVFIGSHPLKVGDRFDFDGVIQWNDSVKCVCIDDYKRGKTLTISPYIQKSSASRNISELIYKSSEDMIYILTPETSVQLPISVSSSSKFLFHETGSKVSVITDFEIFPVDGILTISYEMLKNRIGVISCEVVEVMQEGEIKEYPIRLLVLANE